MGDLAAGAGVMTLGWVIKAQLEEEFLRQELGTAAYDEYARRVPMLSPFPRRRRTAAPRTGL